MTPIISIVGKSNSGKTTLIEKLVPELTRRGYVIATVKHDVHGFQVDHEGKDSWRHKQAGARAVVISSPSRFALIQDVSKDLTLDEIRDRLGSEFDLIISEGFKKDTQPKIEVVRRARGSKPICTKADHVVAIVSDLQLDLGVPCLALEDTSGLADLIERTFLRHKPAIVVNLKVNRRKVPLNNFVRLFLTGTIRGMLTSLKGADPSGCIDLHIEGTTANEGDNSEPNQTGCPGTD